MAVNQNILRYSLVPLFLLFTLLFLFHPYMAAQNGILIPNEVLSDISDFVRVNEVKNLTFVSRTFSAVTAKRLSIINAVGL